MATPTIVPGKPRQQDILLYALSTCPMCKRVKKLLNENEVAYRFIDVDLLEPAERESTKAQMRKWHPKTPFPMIVIDNQSCVIGDEPEPIKKALGL